MKKFFLIGVACILAVLVVLGFSYSRPESREILAPEVAHKALSQDATLKFPELPSGFGMEGRTSSSGRSRLISYTKLVQEFKAPFETAVILKQPQALVTASQDGDATAALSLYFASMNCLVFQDSAPELLRAFESADLGGAGDCRALPSGFAHARHKMLAAAASGSSPLAQFLFGRETLLSASRLQRAGRWVSDPLHGAALTALTRAAQFGISEAYADLSAAYGSGALGARDDTMAAAYVKAFEQLDGRTLPTAAQVSLRAGDSVRVDPRVVEIVSRCCEHERLTKK